ncbi:MAG: HD domain-containing protein [Defluviitaleaceae bacterium]|nr:HD domain-containing protein [Defluviitaleaceae bacterium]
MIILPYSVTYIINELEKNGFEAFAVGGCVRDSLMGRECADWDITTNAEPKEVIRVFEALGKKVLPTGITHGTVTLMLKGAPYEITTYRVDGRYSDGRRPDSISFCKDLKEDLSRRDFTINAMAFSPRTGLVDYFGGKADLAGRVIRCVGDASMRFGEDYLRMMRAYRFASVLDFNLDENIRRAVLKNRDKLAGIAAERVRMELDKLMLADAHDKFLMFMEDLGSVVLPEVFCLKNIPQRNCYHYLNVYGHTMEVFRNSESDLTQRLCALLHDTGKAATMAVDENGDTRFPDHAAASRDIAFNIMKRLRYDNARIQAVTAIIRLHNVPKHVSRTLLKRRIKCRGEVLTRQLYKFAIADCMGKNDYAQEVTLPILYNNLNELEDIMKSGEAVHMTDLAVNGYDVGMALGIRGGEEIGTALNRLLEVVHERPELNNKGDLLEIIKNAK